MSPMANSGVWPQRVFCLCPDRHLMGFERKTALEKQVMVESRSDSDGKLRKASLVIVSYHKCKWHCSVVALLTERFSRGHFPLVEREYGMEIICWDEME